ncbi:NAD(P)-dependent oxidoreductase [Streptomyces sp. T12]|uniref:NAD(P)-dependent oxidoreductase n=1 Tax=Streptomyces sp. T12 TaxID=477697 RepID=UPI0035A2E14F
MACAFVRRGASGAVTRQTSPKCSSVPERSGANLINTAQAKIVDRDAVDRALYSGQLAGCAGDVRPPPAAK